MALPPCRVGHHFVENTSGHVNVEVFLDLHCPFSKKAYKTLKELASIYEGKVQFIMLNWIQPWHAQATWLHQAALAISLIDKCLYWKMIDLLYEKQDEFKDDKMEDISKKEFFQKLSEFAISLGADGDTFNAHLTGERVIQIMKWELKYGRQNGIHSSPTFMVNGLIASNISSSWDLNQWKELLDPLL